MFRVPSGAGGGSLLGSRSARVISGRAVQFLANKTKAVSKATTSFDRGQIKSIDVHGVWVSRGSRVQAKVLVTVGWLGSVSSVHEGNFPGNFFLKSEMGGFFVPEGEGGRYYIHGLDAMHNPGRNSRREVGDQRGGIFQFVVLSVDNVQLEHVNVFLELLSGIDTSGGQPIHGFWGGVGVDKGVFKIGLELSEGSTRQGSQSLLASDFCPYGSRSLLHVGQGEGDLSIVVIVQGVID